MSPRYVKKIHEFSQRENPGKSISWNLPVTQAQEFFSDTNSALRCIEYWAKENLCTSVTARFIKQSLGAFCDLLPVIYCLDLSAFLFSTPLSPGFSIQVGVLPIGVKSYKVPRCIIYSLQCNSVFFYSDSIRLHKTIRLENNTLPNLIITFNLRNFVARNVDHTVTVVSSFM